MFVMYSKDKGRSQDNLKKGMSKEKVQKGEREGIQKQNKKNPGGVEIFRHLSTQALGPTLLPIRWAPGLFPACETGRA
jgi:hypothetical protein